MFSFNFGGCLTSSNISLRLELSVPVYFPVADLMRISVQNWKKKKSGWFLTMIWAQPWRWQWREGRWLRSASLPAASSRTWAGRRWAASVPPPVASLSPPAGTSWRWTCCRAPVCHRNKVLSKPTIWCIFSPEILAKLNSLAVSINFNRSFRNFLQSKSWGLNSLNRCIQLKTINTK